MLSGPSAFVGSRLLILLLTSSVLVDFNTNEFSIGLPRKLEKGISQLLSILSDNVLSIIEKKLIRMFALHEGVSQFHLD